MEKIIIMNTSPRAKGNCAALAERLQNELQGAGAQVETIAFKDANINYCQGCNACMKHDTVWCMQKDDMAELLPRLDECDGLIVLSPIYFGEPTAQAKTVIDRMYAFFNPAKDNMTVATKFGKKVVAITTCGGSPIELAEEKAKTIASVFGIAGFTESKFLGFNGLNVPGSIAENAEALAKVDEIAQWMIA